MTFALAHLVLSTITMIIALLVFLAGFNISGLTSWLLGSSMFGLTVATIVYYVLCLRRFMEPLELDILNTEFVFINNAALGLLLGSIFMIKGNEAVVGLLGCLLNALLALPLLLVLPVLKIATSLLFFARFLLEMGFLLLPLLVGLPILAIAIPILPIVIVILPIARGVSNLVSLHPTKVSFSLSAVNLMISCVAGPRDRGNHGFK